MIAIPNGPPDVCSECGQPLPPPDLGVDLGVDGVPQTYTKFGGSSKDLSSKPLSLVPVGSTPVRGKSKNYPPNFESFWVAYPRKEGKAEAFRAWKKAISLVDNNTLIDAVLRYAADPNREPQFTKHGSRWLNAGCWDDESLPARGGLSGLKKVARSLRERGL